jgi:hypothetical protein
MRADHSYVTITARRWCGGQVPEGGLGERIRATVHWSAAGGGEDQSCVAAFTGGGFAICYVPPRDVLETASVPVTIEAPGTLVTGALPGFTGLESVFTTGSQPHETSGLTGVDLPQLDANYPKCSYLVNVRMDVDFVTTVVHNTCGEPRERAEAVSAIVHWSAIDAGPDERCEAVLRNGFANCLVEARVTGKTTVEVPVTVTTEAGDYQTTFVPVQ